MQENSHADFSSDDLYQKIMQKGKIVTSSLHFISIHTVHVRVTCLLYAKVQPTDTMQNANLSSRYSYIFERSNTKI